MCMYLTMKYLKTERIQSCIQFYFRVTLRSDENKMTAQNLSTVFAPTLMPMPDLIDFKGAIPDMNRDISALHVIIENQNVIFN